MTKGQVEAKLSEAISKFEIEHMGRGPEKIRTIIVQDLIVIRLQGFLNISEKNLAVTKEGNDLVKKMRYALFENSRDYLKMSVQSVIDVNIQSIYSDVSTETGEKVIVITVNENLEERFK